MARFRTRSSGDEGTPTSPVQVLDPGFKSEFPEIHDYMTVEEYEDGSPRQTASLIIFYDAGALKACFNDRDTSRVVFATGGSFSGLLASLEAMLASGEVEWRQSVSGDRKRRTKKY